MQCNDSTFMSFISTKMNSNLNTTSTKTIIEEQPQKNSCHCNIFSRVETQRKPDYWIIKRGVQLSVNRPVDGERNTHWLWKHAIATSYTLSKQSSLTRENANRFIHQWIAVHINMAGRHVVLQTQPVSNRLWMKSPALLLTRIYLHR